MHTTSDVTIERLYCEEVVEDCPSADLFNNRVKSASLDDGANSIANSRAMDVKCSSGSPYFSYGVTNGRMKSWNLFWCDNGVLKRENWVITSVYCK